MSDTKIEEVKEDVNELKKPTEETKIGDVGTEQAGPPEAGDAPTSGAGEDPAAGVHPAEGNPASVAGAEPAAGTGTSPVGTNVKQKAPLKNHDRVNKRIIPPVNKYERSNWNQSSKIIEVNADAFNSDKDSDYMSDEDDNGYNYNGLRPVGLGRGITRASHRDRACFTMMSSSSRICPSSNLDLYLKHVDRMVVLDNNYNALRKKATDLLEDFHKDFRRTKPEFLTDYMTDNRKKLYDVVTDAYEVIKTKLRSKTTKSYDEHEKLVAALEVVGAIIMMPGLLKVVDYKYGKNSCTSMLTDNFASKWTRNRISKITWPSDKNGLFFHFVKKSITRIG